MIKKNGILEYWLNTTYNIDCYSLLLWNSTVTEDTIEIHGFVYLINHYNTPSAAKCVYVLCFNIFFYKLFLVE